MNFLAHLWLADHSGTSFAGAILGDIVRGPDLSAYPDEIAQGIRVHRHVDAATDRHPQIAALRSGYVQGERRYAGIVIDLACDYALAQNWGRHAREPLDAFCARAAVAVAGQAQWFAQAGAQAPDAADFTRLLLSYSEPEGIDRALARIATRMRAPERLLRAAQAWERTADALRASLPGVLDDLVTVARTAAARPAP